MAIPLRAIVSRLFARRGTVPDEGDQLFRRIFEESPLGIVLAHGDDNKIVQANPAFCQMLGYSEAELVGRTIREIAHIDDRDLPIRADPATARPVYFVERRYITRSGAIVWGLARNTLLSVSRGSRTLVLSVVEDITRQKQGEAELRQAQKMEAIGQLTGGIAHDFNNLLGVIIGNVEFLMTEVAGDPDQTDVAREILNSALSGADLTRRLLAFARRQTLQPREIDLNEHLSNLIPMLRRVLGEIIQVSTRLAPNLWLTRADPSQVGDALLNLTINARDAMPHGGSISIETANARLDGEGTAGDVAAASDDYVMLSVTDTGIGMPREVLERALEPFFSTKGPGAGSGLGLSMIYGFAKQSGGHLKIDSEPGRGTTVRIYLPRMHAVRQSVTDAAADPAPLQRGEGTILLVDDNREMRTVARRHLVSLGYRVHEAESGTAALAILEADTGFDLLFTDVVMPGGMTGYQLAAAVAHRWPDVKVLMTTGYAGAGSAHEAGEPTFTAVLRKPYRKRELAEAVGAALGARVTSPGVG